MDIESVHSLMLDWYGREKRDLPWRRTRDPYRIWVSEIMLQQTRVEAVIPYYNRFISSFPSVASLASADPDKLLNLWAGLGYYSRARNLQAAAKQVMEIFGGEFPGEVGQLRRLKGIGPYTSAAIASIAFDRPYAALDGNLERVFSRLLNSRKDPKSVGRRELEDLGGGLASLGRAGDLNQSFMDLASSVCRPKEPRCPLCPVAEHCGAKAAGTQKEIPVRKAKLPLAEMRAHGLVLVAGGELLLARRPAGKWLQGLWDIPWWLEDQDTKPRLPGNPARFHTHALVRTITRHRIHFVVEGLQWTEKPHESELTGLPGSEFRWVPFSELHGINLPRPSEKALEAALAQLDSLR